MFFAPDHVRDPHLQIVDDDGEVVRRGAVGLPDHEVLHAPERHLPPQLIDEATATPGRAEVEPSPPRLIRALVGEIGIQQTRGGSLVEFPTLALAVRALVEREPEPGEVFELRPLELGSAPLPVGVLDTEDQIPAVMSGEEIIEERGARTAEVEEPRRARGEANPDPAQRRSRRHTAWAAMPSFLPGKPRRSVVVPRTPTRDSSTPRADARFFLIASLWSLILGRSQMTTASTLATSHNSPTSPRTSRSNSIESASLYRSSVSGKYWPMSSRPAAPRRASATAWASTSASEWPRRPLSEGISTPPSTSLRPSSGAAKAWTSTPSPTRIKAWPHGHPRARRVWPRRTPGPQGRAT